MFKSLSLKVIVFGFIFTFFSSFGQSFFLGLFNPSIRNDLNISHGQFGSIYALATICSSLVLVWFGKKIDDLKLFNYSLIVIFLLIFSSFFFSIINNLYLLIIGIFLMRFSGQGLMSHTSTTTIARYFNKSRGKALSAGWFGLSTAEFILPILIVYLLTITTWQNIWISISITVLVFLPIISFLLVKNLNFESREEDQNKLVQDDGIKQWKRIEVIKDYRFYIICLNMLAMPWIATGIFVFQSYIAESKSWGDFIIPQSFMAYSIFSVISLLGSGFLIDKFSSRNLITFINIPLLLSAIVIIYFNHPVSAFIFLGLIGISNGLANVLGSSTWAEIYGVKHIGSIKALTTALMVFSTAFGTALFGYMIDIGFLLNQIFYLVITYLVISILILYLIKDKIKPHQSKI